MLRLYPQIFHAKFEGGDQAGIHAVFMLVISEIINILIRQQALGHIAGIKSNGDDENRAIWFLGGSIKGEFQIFMKKSLLPNRNGE